MRIQKRGSLVSLLLFLDAGKIFGLVIFASVVKRTFRTVRTDWLADELAESYEDFVQWQPILPVSQPRQLFLSLIRSLGLNHADPIEDPMNMSIDRNRGGLESVDKDTVGGLLPN